MKRVWTANRGAESDRIRRKRGFSFIEILFAVLLLGIGFILIAAMMPVAVLQSRETVDQTVAAQVAKGAAETLTSIAEDGTIPETYDSSSGLSRSWGTARVFSFGDPVPWGSSTSAGEYAKSNWQLVRGKMIYTADPRYAWTVMFSREWRGSLNNMPPYAQLFIVVSRIGIRDRYTEADLRGSRPNLRPREVFVNLYEGSRMNPPGPDIVEFNWFRNKRLRPSGLFNTIATEQAVAAGTFLVISDDQQGSATYKRYENSDTQSAGGLANGRIYRVGRARPDLGADRWELVPGWDMPTGIDAGGPGPNLIMHDPDPSASDNTEEIPVDPGKNPSPAKALILGRASVDPANATAFEGPAQDIAIFTTFIPLLK